jgi:hypothetical protein
MQVEIEDGHYEEKAPIATNENATTHEFRVCADGERYSDIGKSYFRVKVKVTRQDGTKLTEDDDVALVNNAMQPFPAGGDKFE